MQEAFESIRDKVIRNNNAKSGETCRLDLSNNNFWFSEYTAVPPSRVTRESMNELSHAHGWGVLSTSKLDDAMSNLQGNQRQVLINVTHMRSGFAVGIDSKDDLANTMINIPKKWAVQSAGDFDAYITHTIPEAMQKPCTRRRAYPKRTFLEKEEKHALAKKNI